MSGVDNRQPPRFVPTLTDVVPEAEHPSAAPAPFAAETVQAVPVQPLTPQGTDEPAVPCAAQSSASFLSPVSEALKESDWSAMAESMQTKVMARLDEDLEERLRYALADMVQLHTQALYQAIREDVEKLVQTSIHEAIAQELALLRAPSKP